MLSFLNSDYQAILGTLDGTTATVSVWLSDTVGTNAPQTLADLAGIATESTATGYARADVTLAYSTVDQRLRIDPGDLPVNFDLDGDTDVYCFVTSLPGANDAARDILAMQFLPVAVPGFDGFAYNPANGIAGIFSDDGPGSPQTWGTGATGSAYLDRGRVWLDGTIATTSGSGALGTLPTGHRPAATVLLPVTFINNAAGTPACLPGLIQITSAGVVTLESTTALTGNVTTPLGGLTFQVAT